MPETEDLAGAAREDATSRWLAGYRPWKYGVLLLSLVALFAMQPFLADQVLGLRMLDILSTLAMLAAAVAAARTRRGLVAAAVLGLPALLVPKSDTSARGFEIVFLVFALAMVLADVLRGQRVTRDKLYGSLCGYLLLAAVWAVGYASLDENQPGSFRSASGEPGSVPFSSLLYFSLITLTTVGYGDVVPASDAARSLCALEAVAGQFYISVLVARLVSLYVMAQERREGPETPRQGMGDVG